MTVKIGQPALRPVAASALWLLMAGAAAAQQAPRPPAELVSCLCLQQSLAHQNETITAKRQAFDKRRQELAQLDAEVEAQRPQVNVNDAAAVAAFRQLLERRDAAQQAVDA